LLRVDLLQLAAALVIVVFSPIRAGADPKTAAAHLDRVTELFAPNATEAQMKAGFEVLLAAMTELVPTAGLPAECGTKLAAARWEVTQGTLGGPKTAGPLADCYRLAHGGKAFRVPDTIDTLDEAMSYARQRVQAARALIADDKGGDGLRALLEAALLIVTPLAPSG